MERPGRSGRGLLFHQFTRIYSQGIRQSDDRRHCRIDVAGLYALDVFVLHIGFGRQSALAKALFFSDLAKSFAEFPGKPSLLCRIHPGKIVRVSQKGGVIYYPSVKTFPYIRDG